MVDVLRTEGIAGATVLKGIAGFGHDRDVHTIALEVAAQGLRVVVEVVDTPERIDRVLPKLEALTKALGLTIPHSLLVQADQVIR
ncbi:MAG: DUF190 domain-containing protein [Candidatus Rokubacteria bacterium]|nr:DUF190 domain-containing protein [Candidatus Rokubacteria bacterium]